MGWIDTLKFQEDGLIPVIVQDSKTGEILMFAFANRESLEQTVKSGNIMTYWSRTRKKLWKKGEESGNIQKVEALFTDCDKDAILVKIEQIGGRPATPASAPASLTNYRGKTGRTWASRFSTPKRSTVRNEDFSWFEFKPLASLRLALLRAWDRCRLLLNSNLRGFLP